MPFAQIMRVLTEEPWACTEAALRAMTDVVGARLHGEKTDLASTPEIAAALRIVGTDDAMMAPYEIHDGVALVDVEGTLVKRPFLCFASMLEIRERMQAALDDPAVDAILLSLDSPGGTVDGTAELAAWLRDAGAAKPIYAYADGLMCSGAYWLASQAREIAAPATAMVGSIGVIAAHWDYSKFYEGRGTIKTYLSSGLFKSAGHEAAPLSDESRAYKQEQLDQVRDLFVADVAQGRKLSTEDVRATEARIYLAAAALDAGLVDRIVPDRAAWIAHISATVKGSKEDFMDLKQLRAEHPDLVAQIEAEAKSGAAKDKEEAVAKASVAERDRVVGLVRTVVGEKASEAVAALASSGIDASQAAIVAKALGGIDATAAAPTAQQRHLDALEAAHGSQGVRQAQAAEGSRDFKSLVEQRMAASGSSRADAMAWVVENHPEAHSAYLKGGEK